MPISSAEIAQLNGSFAHQYAQQMQYANMIGQRGPMGMPMNPHVMGEGMAGAALNRGTAIGAPMATLGLGLMGLDPISMGMRAGSGAMGMGAGIGGGVMAGVGAAGAMSAGIAGVAYMGNQMSMGAQQVQGFNQNMRGSFGFTNSGASGGRGFGQGDIREMGNMVRSMAGGGEQGFDELGRLASQMGRMGMAEGARNAKEFGDKFREMMKTVKVIAKEMSTSLEEAQTMMASMRGSGIFNRQGQVSNQIRQAAVAGNLATTEVTGMMNVGSQISRMYGGTGRQGAMGGMESISQIGIAQSKGIISEEDIYNTTGLTGAEGRRALAMNQMQGTGQFLKSGKGRHFLASVAGKDGELDQESVNNWMAGGMGVGETRSQGQRNLGRVGRANFIRNEGRLRGAVMEQFGGLAPAMAMSQWAQGKGIDINNMDDRSMLFAQRQLGMGRDEADTAIQMARKLPELMQARRESRSDDGAMRESAERAKGSGLEGLKSRFDKARNSVNNEMQRAGQDIMNVASDTVASWANKLAGTYEERAIQGIREARRAASMGGAGGARITASLYGSGPIKGGGSGTSGPHEDIGQARYREQIDSMRFSANMGELGKLSSAGQSFASEQGDFLRSQYAGGLAALGGEDRMSAIQRIVKNKGGAVAEEFKRMNQSQRAAFIQQVERDIGIKEGGRLGDVFQDPGLAEMRGGDGPRTGAEFHNARGREMLGLESKGMVQGLRSVGIKAGNEYEAASGGAGGAAVGGALRGASKTVGAYGDVMSFVGRQQAGALGYLAGGSAGRRKAMGMADSVMGIGSDLVGELDGSSKMARSASEYLDSSEGRERIFGMLTGSKDALKGAQLEAADIQSRMAKGEKLTDEDNGRLGILQRGMIAAKVTQAGGADKLSDSDWEGMVNDAKKIVEREGGDPSSVTRETVVKMYGAVSGAAAKQQKEIVMRVASQARKDSLQTRKELVAGGIAELGASGMSLTKATRDKLMKSGGSKALQAAELALAAQNKGSQVLGTADSVDSDRALLMEQEEMQGNLFDRMSMMSTKELKGFAQATAGTDMGGMASEQLMLGNRMRSRMKKGKGGAFAIAGELGLDLSADELAGMKGLSSSEQAARLAGKLGVGGNAGFSKELTEAIDAAGKGGAGAQRAASVLSRAIAQADPDTKKKIMEAQGRGPNPMERIADKISEGNKFLEALVKSNSQANNKLQEIANSAKKDGEAA